MADKKRMFGTDGVRGIANKELTIDLATKIGMAAAKVLCADSKGEKIKVLIGMDTRISSKMLEAALTAGLCSVGADVIQIGVVPTPAVAYLVGVYGADAGIMISASHNSCEYNGIKLFNSKGFKLSDEIEDKIESEIEAGFENMELPEGGDVGRVTVELDAVDKYIQHIISSVDVDCKGLKVALDCANGSSSVTAKKIFEALGAEIHIINDTPDGVNINEQCGSTYMDGLMEYVKANKMDIGLAFDGDADRCLAVDGDGNMVDGDQLIAIAALDMKERNLLKKDTAVVTVMSNMGFWKFAEDNGINTEKTGVGDRYVLECMLENGYNIGGEQSGHIIFLDYASTGDGQLTGVQMLGIMCRKGETLKDLAKVMTIYPQVLKNIMVSPASKDKFSTCKPIWDAVENAEKQMAGDGRVLVRASGTEPKIRVMLEGKDYNVIEKICDDIINVIRENLC
ncbi:MAG: phosphoglucosamine mutase [Clostridia bacterium]|nr:phosphoglucosamine mutase [Clostridia bacterium]